MSDEDLLRPVLVRMLEGRVGSTLVMRLLGTAPEVLYERIHPYENSYLTYFARLVGQISASASAGADMVDFVYGDGAHVGPIPFPALDVDRGRVARESLHGVWGAFSAALRSATAKPGGHLYAEKFWGDVGVVIAAGLDPIVIDLVRDPRDVIASIRAFNARTGRALFGRAAVDDDRRHLRRLVAGMSLRLGEFAAPLAVTHLVIRYEDLVFDLPAQTSRLQKALGVRLDHEAVSRPTAETARHMTSESAAHSVGRWGRDLPPDEVALVERKLGRAMRDLGYALATGEGDSS